MTAARPALERRIIAAVDATPSRIPVVLGEHFIHDTSYFHRSFRYVDRQRNLARVQAQAVRELGLPRWMYLYALGRHAYAYFPLALKRVLRRRILGWRERDV